ncbi:heptaprenyl diphosphate synthase component 1 [Kyrpidia sp.]|uniref:heptaprenyl diphosphate synthase component 1 n=1 Tax=Kyrpidia sp. TaxID=2073077 RepID=UPI0017D916EA|nr:heptaprenyl diphosphate synthase component 1 [Kyrpidia sp.]MCL6574534.1 heptaprenyl diphosphate synthase component 1 [Kyrpidia sp.]HHY66321.1 heptaprenyl diphosphate synthase component 1 [Alicyclobacillus sp.]
MLLTDWEMEMRCIEKMIAREMNHPELRQWSSEPLDRSLIWLIWSMGASAGLGPALRAAVAAAVYLVHRGLEVHEVERAQPGGGGVSATAVLAGDFFSSKYYLLLAKYGLVSLVGVLSGGVRRVNELKVRRRSWRWDEDPEGYVALCAEIETGVVRGLLRGLSLRDPWPEVVRAAGRGFALVRGGEWGHGGALPSLMDLHVWASTTAEERRALEESEGSGRVRALYAKYNAGDWVTDQLTEVCSSIRSRLASLPRLGAEGLERMCSEWEAAWASWVPVAKER